MLHMTIFKPFLLDIRLPSGFKIGNLSSFVHLFNNTSAGKILLMAGKLNYRLFRRQALQQATKHIIIPRV